MAIQIDGAGTITGLDADGISSQPVFPGQVLQVVSTTKTDVFTSTTKNAWTNISGLSASITPSATNSKIMILCSISSPGGGNNFARGLRLARGSTGISVADAGTGTSGSGGVFTQYDQGLLTVCLNFLDSPNTTSSTTYNVQFYTPNSATTGFTLNRPHTPDSNSFNGTSTITLMEIAG